MMEKAAIMNEKKSAGYEKLIKGLLVVSFVHQLIEAIIGLALIFIYRKQKALRCSAEGLKEGLICGAAWLTMLLIALADLFLNQMTESGLKYISWWEIALLILQCALIGLFEEGVFRGIATELSFELFGTDTKKNAKLAIAFTSFLFGAVHLVNALQPEVSLKVAALQGFAAFGCGLVYGAIYYRSKRSIWPCVIFHAIQDFAAFIASGALHGITQEEAIGSTGITQAVSSILFIIWFCYLMREQPEREQ